MSQLDDLVHNFIQCERLSALFQLTQSIIRKLLPTIDKLPFWWYMVGIPPKSLCDHNVNTRRLVNWIFAISKIAIIHSRFNKVRGEGTTDACILFKSKVMSRLNVEFKFSKYHRSIDAFQEKWNINNSLCIVNVEGGIEFNF